MSQPEQATSGPQSPRPFGSLHRRQESRISVRNSSVMVLLDVIGSCWTDSITILFSQYISHHLAICHLPLVSMSWNQLTYIWSIHEHPLCVDYFVCFLLHAKSISKFVCRAILDMIVNFGRIVDDAFLHHRNPSTFLISRHDRIWAPHRVSASALRARSGGLGTNPSSGAFSWNPSLGVSAPTARWRTDSRFPELTRCSSTMLNNAQHTSLSAEANMPISKKQYGDSLQVEPFWGDVSHLGWFKSPPCTKQ